MTNEASPADATKPEPSAAPPRASLVANVAMTIGSLTVALAFAEVVVRVFLPVREVGPRFAIYDPVYGKTLRKNFSGERRMLESTYTLSTNSLGFRGPEPEAPLKDTILFLGDSFTMGFGVTDGREYPAVVRAALRAELGSAAPEVINAGIGNTGNGRWIRFLARDAKALSPKVVVFQFCQNDISDNLREAFFSLTDSGELVEAPSPVKKSGLRRAQELVETIPGITSSYLFNLALEAMLTDRTWATAAGGAPISEPREHPHYEHIITLTAKLVERSILGAQQNGWPTILVLPIELLPPELHARLRAVADAHDTPVIELPAKQDRPELYFAIDGHWNDAGHADAAKALLAHPRFRALTGLPPTQP
jgi:lysophospholipase L1-like esterase